MEIEICNTAGAFVTTLTAEDAVVPRPGDELAISDDQTGLDGYTEFLVSEVIFKLDHSRLTPVIRCQALSARHFRRQTLEDQGWLQPLD